MRARDADLGTLWGGVHYRFEQAGLSVPPRRWRVVHRFMQEIFAWGATGSPRRIRAKIWRLIEVTREVS